MKEELIYQIALRNAEGIGPIVAKNLVGYSGGVKEIFRAASSKLRKIPGVGDKAVRTLKSKQLLLDAEVQVAELEKHRIQTLFFTEKNYPQRLSHCPDAPILVYKKGDLDANGPKLISIVGTRSATKYGQKIVTELLEVLSTLKVIVVSGLAYGIDLYAHKCSLSNNIPTVAVLAHGLDMVYPSVHRKYALQIENEGGALLSEYPIGAQPDRKHFPARNRIVAGMSDATIVVESAVKGGSLITAQLAFDYNRDVFAYPGRASDKYSIGCNQLIQKNIARLVNKPEEILEYLSWNAASVDQHQRQMQIPVDLGEEEQTILELLPLDIGQSIHLNELALLSKMPHSKLASLLLSLEFKGLINHLPGSSYSKV